jgi:hypothetical protein
MGNKNLFASALFLMLPFCLYGVVRGRPLLRVAACSAVALVLVLVLLSRTRAVWLALFVSVVLTTAILLLTVYQHRLKPSARMNKALGWRLGLIALSILCLVAAVVSLRGSPRSIRGLVASVLDIESMSQRLGMWGKTIEMIRDHPLLGVGAGNWKVVIPSYGIPDEVSGDWAKMIFVVRPHNDFLGVLAETGALGLGLYLAVFGVFFFYVHRLLSRSARGVDAPLVLMMFFGVTGYLVIAFFCFPSERIFHSMLLLLMIAVVTVLHQRHLGCCERREPAHPGVFLAAAVLLVSAVTVFAFFRLHMEIHVRRAMTARAAGNYSVVVGEIDRAYSRLNTLDATSTPLMWYRGEACFLSGDMAQAKECYQESLRAHPHHIHVLNNLATCHQTVGDSGRAIECYERLLKVAPRFVEGACNLAAVYFNADESEKALRILMECDPEGMSPLVERYRRIVSARIQRSRMPTLLCETDVLAAASSVTAHTGSANVFRLWTAASGRFFYTIEETERDRFLARRGEVWICEGVDFHAFRETCMAGLSPVHRFYGPELKSYFYTIAPSEVENLIKRRDGQWQHQDVAFFAFAPGDQPADALPVYRFWSGKLRYHLYTIDEGEKNELQTAHSDIWTFEGVAWYAYR